MASSSNLAVLCYHHVDFPRAKAYNVSTKQLTEQLQALKAAGFTFVSMEDLRLHYQGQISLPSRSVLVTFDDGNRNTYTTAWPLLRQLKIPMTVFVYPTAISAGHKRGFMSWDEVCEMSKAGVEFGTHGFDHPYLPYPPKSVKTKQQFDDWLLNETKGAKDYVEKRISRSVTTLALPFGLEDVESYYAIKRAGYEFVFNISGMTNNGHADPKYLNRIMVVDQDSTERILQKALSCPLILKERFPPSLGRIYTPTTNIHFLFSNEDQVLTRSVRVELSSHGLGSSKYDEKTGYNWQVGLYKDRVYSVSVRAVNKNNEPCFASWSFIKQKTKPTYWY
jgi:peptidoglycan/xylan/chitin deacetylase (PgdA/CDA1 family)